MLVVVKKRKLVVGILIVFLIIINIGACFRMSVPVFVSYPIETIIIDPGHGGNDPGAIGVSGVCEKDINLEVSLVLKELAEELGYRVVMTRESDVALYDQNAANKKRSDLNNRRKITEDIPSAIFISIHMNKYADASVKGAQTFYSSTEESKRLAEAVQSCIVEMDPNNHRVAMKTPKTVYILQDTKRPSILVEGGFLSNPTEERKLLDGEYQKLLAGAILKGVTDFLNTSESKE